MSVELLVKSFTKELFFFSAYKTLYFSPALNRFHQGRDEAVNKIQAWISMNNNSLSEKTRASR